MSPLEKGGALDLRVGRGIDKITKSIPLPPTCLRTPLLQGGHLTDSTCLLARLVNHQLAYFPKYAVSEE